MYLQIQGDVVDILPRPNGISEYIKKNNDITTIHAFLVELNK